MLLDQLRQLIADVRVDTVTGDSHRRLAIVEPSRARQSLLRPEPARNQEHLDPVTTLVTESCQWSWERRAVALQVHIA